jgi:DnaK suppressor protein
MPLRKEKLESFKKELIARRQVLARELEQSTADFINDEPMYADSIDQATAETDKSLVLQIKNRDRVLLANINEALRRLEAGIFGDCERCGEQISEARIRANLGTTLCIDCKAELESEEHRFPRRA